QQHGTTPGGQHDVVPCSKYLDRLALALTKSRFAFLLENERDIDARAALDLSVAVIERQPQDPRQMLADSTLARSHRTDEEQVAFREHGESSILKLSVLRPPRTDRRPESKAAARRRPLIKRSTGSHQVMVTGMVRVEMVLVASAVTVMVMLPLAAAPANPEY